MIEAGQDVEQAPPAVNRMQDSQALPDLAHPRLRGKSRQLRHFRANSGDGLQAGKLFVRAAPKPALFIQQPSRVPHSRINDDPQLRELRLKEEEKVRKMVGLSNLNGGSVQGTKRYPRGGMACCSPRTGAKAENASCNPECSIF